MYLRHWRTLRNTLNKNNPKRMSSGEGCLLLWPWTHTHSTWLNFSQDMTRSFLSCLITLIILKTRASMKISLEPSTLFCQSMLTFKFFLALPLLLKALITSRYTRCLHFLCRKHKNCSTIIFRVSTTTMDLLNASRITNNNIMNSMNTYWA